MKKFLFPVLLLPSLMFGATLYDAEDIQSEIEALEAQKEEAIQGMNKVLAQQTKILDMLNKKASE